MELKKKQVSIRGGFYLPAVDSVVDAPIIWFNNFLLRIQNKLGISLTSLYVRVRMRITSHSCNRMLTKFFRRRDAIMHKNVSREMIVLGKLYIGVELLNYKTK